MATVYDKTGKAHECGKEDAVILVKSGHFTKEKPKAETKK